VLPSKLHANNLLKSSVIINNTFVSTGLCILLRRLAYPNRLCDLRLIFHRKKNIISMIFNRMLDFIYTRHVHLLNRLDQKWMNQLNLSRFASAIHDEGAPLNNCIGFVDGEKRYFVLYFIRDPSSD
jgi:hypothetical protein